MGRDPLTPSSVEMMEKLMAALETRVKSAGRPGSRLKKFPYTALGLSACPMHQVADSTFIHPHHEAYQLAQCTRSSYLFSAPVYSPKPAGAPPHCPRSSLPGGQFVTFSISKGAMRCMPIAIRGSVQKDSLALAPVVFSHTNERACPSVISKRGMLM